MKHLFLIGFICCATELVAQPSVLEQIERNNTVLSALRKQAEAEKIDNKTGIYPDNPEVEFHYLWGSPDAPGNRTDFSAVQHFDFPTAYHYKRKVSDTRNHQVELRYLTERKNILLEAEMLCIRLVCYNAYAREWEARLNDARQIADAYRTKFDKGDASILDLNKAKINLLNVRKMYESAVSEKVFFIAELTRLNGGEPLEYADTAFWSAALPLDFEEWYETQKSKNLSLRYFRQETALSVEQEKLQRALNLPKISAGYMSEKVLTEQFRGVVVGVSLPLWENKNTVKRTKAQTAANRATESDAASRSYNESKALYDKALRLQKIAEDYRTTDLPENTAALLKKALDTGEISLIDFMLELDIYYQSVISRHETERDFQLAVAELMQWDL
jgi:hypothetical protein